MCDHPTLIEAFWFRISFWNLIYALGRMNIFDTGVRQLKLLSRCELIEHQNVRYNCDCKDDACNANENLVARCLATYSQQLLARLVLFFSVYFNNFWNRFACWNFNNFAHSGKLFKISISKFLRARSFKYYWLLKRW